MSLIATTDTSERAQRTSRARRIWSWVAILAVIVITGSVVYSFQSEWSAPDPLAADSPRYDGARAITTILEERGTTVTTADDADAARAALSSRSTLVITDTRNLDIEPLRELADDARETVILDGDIASLDAVIPGIEYADAGSMDPIAPMCSFPAADNAGEIIAGTAYTAPPDAAGCYPVGDGYALVRAEAASGSAVTVFDGNAVLANENLAQAGNAALALGVLGSTGDVVWYSPSPEDAGTAGAASSIADLLPGWVTPAIVLGILAAIAAGLWRGRRFGPLVAETLPVTVRAGETLEGRARLYRSSGEPAHALAALRRGAEARMTKKLSLPRDASPETLARAVAGALGRDPQSVFDTLTTTPADDAEFAELGARLREVESALESIDPWEKRSR
ncbi:DUF4350 domain-containing protein [Microbacterium gubbeenense]|uniref:DUF4350 domain-containing protein n=1 Tax=Microbacterium gubbeenense TaxID=159896 RepID=UPI003F95EE61